MEAPWVKLIPFLTHFIRKKQSEIDLLCDTFLSLQTTEGLDYWNNEKKM
jgi:hypothetical protein